jgi:hypothetical protein
LGHLTLECGKGGGGGRLMSLEGSHGVGLVLVEVAVDVVELKRQSCVC